jgi:hypothetical protein
LELGISLSLGFDQTMNMVFDFWAEFFGLFASAEVISVRATDARSKFVEPGINRIAAPAEYLFGLAG